MAGIERLSELVRAENAQNDALDATGGQGRLEGAIERRREPRALVCGLTEDLIEQVDGAGPNTAKADAAAGSTVAVQHEHGGIVAL